MFNKATGLWGLSKHSRVRLKEGANQSLHEEHEQRVKIAKMEARIRESRQEREIFLETYCKPAQTGHYLEWLDGYISAGGKATDFRDNPDQILSEMYVVHSDCEIPSLYGAQSVNLLIAPSVNVTWDDNPHGTPGHSRLFFMDGFRQVGGVVEACHSWA